jgi:hypothetical protein
MTKIEDNIMKSMLSDEELIDIVMSVTPMGASGSIKNIFKLGAKGLKQARDFLNLWVGSNKSAGKGIWNPKVKAMIEKQHKETGLSPTVMKDMAKKRIALESTKYQGKYYPRTEKYRYEE